MSIDLAPSLLAQVQYILKEYVPECQVWVFGSRAHGPAKRFSDLDLALSSTEAIPLRRLALLADAFEESDLPFRVDLLDLRTASPSIRDQINRSGVSLSET